MKIGTKVRVYPETPKGTMLPRYNGAIAGERKNIKALGSHEYLITRDDRPNGLWVHACFVKAIEQGFENGNA